MKMYVRVRTEYEYLVDVPSGNPEEAKDYVNKNFEWLAPDNDNLIDAEVLVFDSDMNEIEEE